MNKQPIFRDERTLVVENASYRIAYLVISFGLLATVAYRSFVLQQNSWDLLALLILSGVCATAYQRYHQVLSRHWIMTVMVTFIVAGLIAVGLLIYSG